MSEIKLLPCPFCGGESTTHSTIVLHKGEYVRVYGCMCKKSHCVILPANYFTQEKAAEKWNTRKPIDRMVEQQRSKQRIWLCSCKRFNYIGGIIWKLENMTGAKGVVML